MSDDFSLDDVIGRYAHKPDKLGKPELILSYGQAGSGKSYLAATAADLPSVKHVLYLDTEGSSVGVLSNIKNANKIDVVRVDKHPQPFQFLATLLSDGKQGLFNTENATKYDVVVVDTLDVAQDMAVDYFMEHAPLGSSGNKDTFAAWKNVKVWTLSVAQGLKRLDALAILVMHDREEKSETGAITKRLAVQGSARDILPGIPDVVAFLERKVKKGVPTTTAFFGVEDTKVTKDRFGFPPQVDNVTIPALYAMIDAKNKEKNEAQ